MSAQDIERGIVWSQTGLTFISWGHAILVAAWAIGAMLGGFCNGILHVPPIAFEIVLIKFVADAIGFGVQLVHLNLVVDTQFKHRTIVGVYVMLVIGIALNITHLVFTAIELRRCTSLICENNFWFLFTFAFILGILAIFEIVMIWYFSRYNRHVYIMNKRLR